MRARGNETRRLPGIVEAPKRETRDAHASVVRIRLLEGSRQIALPNPGPGRVHGSAADSSDGAQFGRAEFRKLAVGLSLDRGDALQDRLKEGRIVVSALARDAAQAQGR